jgi:hypothetical protein
MNARLLAGREQRRSQESPTARVGLLERDAAGGGGAELTSCPGFDGHADVSRDDVISADVRGDDVRRPDEIPSVDEASLTLLPAFNSPELQATGSGVNEIRRSLEYKRLALGWCSARKKLVEAFETRATHLN